MGALQGALRLSRPASGSCRKSTESFGNFEFSILDVIFSEIWILEVLMVFGETREVLECVLKRKSGAPVEEPLGNTLTGCILTQQTGGGNGCSRSRSFHLAALCHICNRAPVSLRIVIHEIFGAPESPR